ncbi:MAG TPA: hypothetical protein VIL20_19515 [Sandaracinaceae bacterium]
MRASRLGWAVLGLALGSMLSVLGCIRVHLGSHDGGGGDDAGRSGDAGPVRCGAVLCAPGQVCCNSSCNLCAPPDAACATVLCTHECTSDADCGPGEFCRFPDGACGGAGLCTALVSECRDVVQETCGCDGVTYLSPCDAFAAGVSVRHDGACRAEPCAAQDAAGEGPCDAELGLRWNGEACESVTGCTCAGTDCDALFSDRVACEAAHAHCRGGGGGCATRADCDPDHFCDYPPGACGGSGECRPLPGEIPCPDGAPPVCGCDGMTYACEVAAHQVGVSVHSEGACSGACAPMDARGLGACTALLGHRWNGSSCEVLTGCSCDGANCPRVFGTQDECEFAHEGCDRPPGGPCGGTRGPCRPDEWCDFPDPHACGATGEAGTCRPRPEGCSTERMPVCGCDGTEHPNACWANRAGYDTRSEGDCGGAP